MSITLLTIAAANRLAVNQGISVWGAIPLRLVIGYGFLAHGYAKLSRGPDTFASVLTTIGVPLPHVMAWLTTGVELVGGLAILGGAFIALVSLPLAAVLLVALVEIHLPYGFFSVKLVEVTHAAIKFGSVGYEIILLYLSGLIALVMIGAGPFSIDARRLERSIPHSNSASHIRHLR